MPWESDIPEQTVPESLCKVAGVLVPSLMALLYYFSEGILSTGYGMMLSLFSVLGILLFQVIITLPLHSFLHNKGSEYLHWYLCGGFTVPALIWFVVSVASSRGGFDFDVMALVFFCGVGMMASGVFGLFRIPFLSKPSEQAVQPKSDRSDG